MKTIILQNDNEINEIMSTEKYSKYLLQLSATWCAPCRRIKPSVEQFVNSIDDSKAVFIYCDIDKCPNIYSYMSVRGIPAFVSIVENDSKLFDVEKITSSSIEEVVRFCEHTGFINCDKNAHLV